MVLMFTNVWPKIIMSIVLKLAKGIGLEVLQTSFSVLSLCIHTFTGQSLFCHGALKHDISTFFATFFV